MKVKNKFNHTGGLNICPFIINTVKHVYKEFSISPLILKKIKIGGVEKI